jgi:serine/threonine protein kinase
MLSLEGQQLGNYDVIRRIRMGGMGAVYEGRQRTAFGRRVAIKVILGDYAADRDMRRRFAREARTIAKLHHPHILQLIEFGDEQGILYLVMPFIEGGTLTNYLRRGLPGLDEVSAIYQQLLDAVEYAHENGLIHRDIKSSNVLLEERRSGAPFVYLADFGLVRNAQQADNSRAGKPIPLDQVPGTPHYMAPEQTRGIVTPQTDIYALGVLLYQMLTGELPYNDPDDIRVIEMHLHDPIPAPSDLDASIPRELDAVVRKAMSKRPEGRFRNVGELRNAFLGALQGSVANARVTGDISIEQSDDDDDMLIEDVDEDDFSPPLRHLPAPLTLGEPLPPFEPVDEAEKKMKPLHFERTEPAPIAVRDERKPRHAPRTIPRKTIDLRPRITEEPTQDQPKARSQQPPRKRPGNIRVAASVVVAVVLVVLLLMPRVLGFSLFPSGFPLFGTAPVATIYVLPQSKTIADKYVLTASPKVNQADIARHIIPGRVVQGAASASNTVNTTGTKTIGGSQAQGTVTFINPGNTPVQVPAGDVLTTQNNIRFVIEQTVNVPPANPGTGTEGIATVNVQAAQPGASGNISAHALDGICCNNSLTVSQNAPFSGGTDAQVVHVVAQADIDGVSNVLVAKLQSQVRTQMQQQLKKNEVMAGQIAYTTTITPDNPVGAQANQVNVKVSVNGTVTVYDQTQATSMAVQLLRAQAAQSLSRNFQLQGDISTGTPGAQAGGGDGSAFVSVSVRGIWAYVFSAQQISRWQQSVRGATPAAALAYLNTQPGIASVQVSLPFGSDHLPDNVDDIKIVKVS